MEWEDQKKGDLPNHSALAKTSSQKREKQVRVSCTCDAYRINGTCDESKFLGLLAGEEYPPPSCVKHSDPDTPVPWKQVRKELIEKFKKRCLFFDDEIVNTLDTKPPKMNPWTSIVESVNSKNNE